MADLQRLQRYIDLKKDGSDKICNVVRTISVSKIMKNRIKDFAKSNKDYLATISSICTSNGIFTVVSSSNTRGGGALALDINSTICKTYFN
jgi:hypothetical protein